MIEGQEWERCRIAGLRSDGVSARTARCLLSRDKKRTGQFQSWYMYVERRVGVLWQVEVVARLGRQAPNVPAPRDHPFHHEHVHWGVIQENSTKVNLHLFPRTPYGGSGRIYIEHKDRISIRAFSNHYHFPTTNIKTAHSKFVTTRHHVQM